MTEIRGPISGSVAAILNARELVINRGMTDGITRGMKFAVLDPRTLSITDPETNEDLGEIYRPKVRVQVVQVEPKLSVARTYELLPGGTFGSLSGVAALFSPTPPRHVTLKRALEQWEELSEKDSYVKIGDPVEQIIEVAESPTDSGEETPNGPPEPQQPRSQ